MFISHIETEDIVNGTGIRLSIYVSGCLNHCKGCFNPESWDFCNGKPLTDATVSFILNELSNEYYSGVTILGGDPYELQNQPDVLQLLTQIKEKYPEKSVWMYTGYIYDEDLQPGGKRFISGVTDKLLSLVDILVDGPFILEARDVSLAFRGSMNQRIIDVKHNLICDYDSFNGETGLEML